jgi:hypothetical protein
VPKFGNILLYSSTILVVDLEGNPSQIDNITAKVRTRTKNFRNLHIIIKKINFLFVDPLAVLSEGVFERVSAS